MTAKEKAAQLVAIYSDFEFNRLLDPKKCAKDCALIAVGQIIQSGPMNPKPTLSVPMASLRQRHAIEYWQQVKNEIENL